jgi:hypothetical protein
VKSKRSFKRLLPWLLLLLIPLWLVAILSELQDARALENESVVTTGRMESPQWLHGRRGRKSLSLEAVWTHEGKEHRKAFNLTHDAGLKLVDEEGRPLVTQLPMRYVPARPELAALDAAPPDPVWVSIVIACVGFCALTGVIVFLIRDWKIRRR